MAKAHKYFAVRGDVLLSMNEILARLLHGETRQARLEQQVYCFKNCHVNAKAPSFVNIRDREAEHGHTCCCHGDEVFPLTNHFQVNGKPSQQLEKHRHRLNSHVSLDHTRL